MDRMTTELYIKNMVCPRCVMAVKEILEQQGWQPIKVELGKAVIPGSPTPEQTEAIKNALGTVGFSLLSDRTQRTVEHIKTLIIEAVGQGQAVKLATLLADRLHTDYSSLSRTFSMRTGMTIERFYILQRIERVKELLRNGELTISEIALKLNYSSVQHLSKQFRTVTGMTPSQFKIDCERKRWSIDKII